MVKSLDIGATGMRAMQSKIDVVSNNLANVNTNGFKKNRANFQDLLYQTEKAPGLSNTAGRPTPTSRQYGLGVHVADTSKEFGQGTLKNTQNPLDVAIEGNGFFQITLPDGTLAYSRAGSFNVDDQGRICNSQGYLLEPQITIPPDAVNVMVGEDGTVSVKQGNEVEAVEIGNIQLASFVNSGGLDAVGGNLFKESTASGAPIINIPGDNGTGSLRQGFLEGSNVEMVNEMVEMITGQRAYELNSKSVKTSDEMLQTATQLKR
ncbi:MAG: flagellar basal-body rod protein FlgG [bacterium]